MLVLDPVSKVCAWITNWDPSRVSGVPFTRGYRDILELLPKRPLFFGDGYQPTFINKNNSCHVDAPLELIFNMECWCHRFLFKPRPDTFSICSTLLQSVVSRSVEVQNIYTGSKMAFEMSAVRDLVAKGLSPLTGCLPGVIGSAIKNMRERLVWTGPSPVPYGIFPLRGLCPTGGVLRTNTRGIPMNLEFSQGWYYQIPSALMWDFCQWRKDFFVSSICPFASCWSTC